MNAPTTHLDGPVITPAREAAIATSGLDTLDETRRGSQLLAPALATPLPAADDHAAWRAVRERGALSQPVLDDPRLGLAYIGGVLCRTVSPAGARTGTYLHLHGGSWSFGSHLSQDARLLALADATGLAVVSVGYRLAPEHQITAAIADATAVTSAVADGDTGFLAIGGESAGAHLAVAALLRHRDAGGRSYDAAVLTFGCFDLAGTPSRRRQDDGLRALTAVVAPGVSQADLRDPSLSPLFADLAGLPPARFVCGTRDGLVDDSLMLEARWRTVADTELDLVAGAEHAFTLADTETTRRAHGREHDYLRRVAAARSGGR